MFLNATSIVQRRTQVRQQIYNDGGNENFSSAKEYGYRRNTQRPSLIDTVLLK